MSRLTWKRCSVSALLRCWQQAPNPEEVLEHDARVLAVEFVELFAVPLEFFGGLFAERFDDLTPVFGIVEPDIKHFGRQFDMELGAVGQLPVAKGLVVGMRVGG